MASLQEGVCARLKAERSSFMASKGQDFEEAQRGVLRRVYRREGDNLVFDPAILATPLSKVLDGEEHIRHITEAMDAETREIIEERLGESMADWLMSVRNHALQVLLDWIYGDEDGPLPRKVLKRLYIFTRAMSRDHVWRMNQQDLADLFGETRAAVCEREKQEVEGFLRLWNASSFTVGGGKSTAARKRYAKERKGNHCRKGGKKVARLYEKRSPADSQQATS